MNEQIKFRALTIDTKEWVFGVPYFLNIKEDEPDDCINKACIITGADWDGTCGFMSPDNNCFIEVIPETVGRMLKKTKDGKEWYAGDIVLMSISVAPSSSGGEYPWIADDDGFQGYAKGELCSHDRYGICIKDYILFNENIDGEVPHTSKYKTISFSRCTIVGNIHENQEA